MFGLTLPDSPAAPLPAAVVTTLASRITAAAAALQDDAPVALAASLRQDARRYLTARRHGQLRLPAGAIARACDDGVHAVMRLTVDSPPAIPVPERMVA